MYRAFYAEISDDDPHEARRREGAAFDHVIARLERAKNADKGADAGPRAAAIDAAGQLWTVLLQDLAGADNALPEALRAQLISVGLWIMREIARLRAGAGDDLDALIAINQSIRSGLR